MYRALIIKNEPPYPSNRLLGSAESPVIGPAGENRRLGEKSLEFRISKQWNGRIKIITGIRRSGKSTLLFDLYRDYLLNSGVSESEIIEIALDTGSLKR